MNSKFYVLANDDYTVEPHYPFTIEKGISQVLKRFSDKLFLFSYVYRHQILLFVLVSVFYFRKDRCAA